jgi:polyketide synthase PksN
LEELSFLRPWSAEKGSLYLRFRPGGEKYEVSFFSKEAEERLYARGILRQEIAPSLPDLSPWLSKPVKQTVSGETLYEFIHQTGFRYGEDYQLLEQLNLSDDQVIASFSLKEQTQRKDDFKVHPILLDAAFQAVIPLLTSFQKQDIAFVPYLMEELRFFQSPGNQGQVLVRKIASASSQRVAVFDLYLLNEVGELCLWLHRLHLVPLSQEEKEVNTQHQVPQLKSDNPIVQSLIKVFAESLGYAEAELDPQQALNHYGLDSILISGVMEKLEVYYPNLPKTLLFEYSTIGEIANFISQNIAPPTLTDMTMPEATPQARPEQPFIRDIAVIGMHGRYPEAEDLNQFWQNLKDGKDCIVEIPEERWPLDGFFDADPNRMGYSYSKWGGYVKEAEYFDPLFFKISPKDAGGIDPQERIFLESVWCAIENAGYRPDNLGSSSRKVGVFVGIMWALYQMHNSEQRALGNLVEANSSYWSVPNRVSYHFNFQGPSIAVDTACSSSLTSIHMACISLLSGESQVAIAGGVNLTLHPYKYYLLSGRFFAAKDGRCRSFGKGGSGYVPGEGVGSLVLKTLEKAQADGDHIYAVIKASSVNHGGKVNGFTVPNPNAQAVVVGDTLDKAGISPAAISYIETHGTGTELGDPIEIAGLNKVMNQGEIPQQSCAIGSVKSNIGHLEASAGIAGVHKVILQMLHKQLVPSLHSRELNPNIDFGNSPFQVQQHLADWPLPNHYPKRLAGVSSFGAGGSNAHVIVEEYEMPVSVAKDPGTQLIILSARDEKRLTATAAQLLEFLQQPGQLVPVNLADLAFTLQVGRTQFDYRLAFVAESLAAVKMRLQEFVQGDFQHLEKGKRAKGIRKMDPAESQRMLQNGEQWKLGQMWCEGVRINWDQLNENATARRIPLPNSLFAKKRYWLPQVGTIPVNGHTQAVSTLTAATETEKTISQPSKPKPDPLSELQYFAVQLREKPIPKVCNPVQPRESSSARSPTCLQKGTTSIRRNRPSLINRDKECGS